jgi:Fic family protein
MQVVSGAIGKQKVHFEAPPPERMDSEMNAFFAWCEDSREKLDGIIRAALAHLYFVLSILSTTATDAWRLQ